MYIDTHCHLDDEKFSDAKSVVDEYLKYGVGKVINMGCEYNSSRAAKTLSEVYDSVYYAVGYHPTELYDFDEKTFESLLTPLVGTKCVAIGEIGLDYHYEGTDKESQIAAFISQIELANKLNLPISVHSRDAMKDTLDILKANPCKCGGVMHCYSGSVESAKILLDMRFYLGFGGTVTFKNSKTVKDVAAYCPTDRMLTETDSPYLSPEPYRGQINQPKNIPIIAYCLSKLKNLEFDDLSEKIMNNAKRLFFKLK